MCTRYILYTRDTKLIYPYRKANRGSTFVVVQTINKQVILKRHSNFLVPQRGSTHYNYPLIK